MKKAIVIFLLITVSSFAQSNFKLVKTIEINSNFITADNQGNFYVVKGNELLKFDKTGKQLYKYSRLSTANHYSRGC